MVGRLPGGHIINRITGGLVDILVVWVLDSQCKGSNKHLPASTSHLCSVIALDNCRKLLEITLLIIIHNHISDILYIY